MPRAACSRRVALVVLEGAVVYDVGVALQVFGPRTARPGRPGQPYELTVCGVRRGSVRTMSGQRMSVDADLGALARADLVVVPGTDVSLPVPASVTRALRAAHAGGARIASICTGAFVIAAAGLLDGRRATTHWGYCDELARRHPTARVDPGVLYVDEGDVLTSAGLSAGMDLCLHIVREELGVEVATAIARWNVVAPHRDGGQAQFIETPIAAQAGEAALARTRAWAQARLAEPLDVVALARHAHMSERTFTRRFRAETGMSPKRWLLAQRVQHARRLLERSDLPIEAVARESGFGSAASLRIHFQRATATRPTAYRATFRSGGDG